MEYTPPAGDAIILDLGPDYIPPLGDAIIFDLGTDDGIVDLREERSPGYRIAWGKLRAVDGGCAIPWGAYQKRDRAVRIDSSSAPRQLQQSLRISWQETERADATGIRLGWGCNRPVQRSTHLPWQSLSRKDRTYRLNWLMAKAYDQLVHVPWVGLQAYDQLLSLAWGAYRDTDRSFVVPWMGIPPKDILHRIYWGRELYDRICRRAYEPPPGDAIALDIDELLSGVGDEDHINLYFDELVYDLHCKQREPSGWRDNHFYVRPKTYPLSPKLTVLLTVNTILLTRLADGAPIEALSVDLAADIDSWTWSFSAKISEASLAIVNPINDPVPIEVDVNGYKWVVLVERWSENHVFARRSYTITGRSQSAMLSETYAPSRSGSNALAENARQLAEAELLNTGFTLDWQIVDWLVAAGALSYSNLPAIKVLQRIVETAGGRIISHRSDKRLHALPRLHSLPWLWGSDTPSLGISDYVVRQLGREFIPAMAINAVFISGESQGVLCKVVRSGTAGNLLAPMIADALITDVEPARERGKMVIGQSGKWSKEQLELPLTRAGVLPGLLEIGQLVSMEERGQAWRGQVVGVRVSAETQGGFRVNQNVEIERYRGN